MHTYTENPKASLVDLKVHLLFKGSSNAKKRYLFISLYHNELQHTTQHQRAQTELNNWTKTDLPKLYGCFFLLSVSKECTFHLI